MCKRNCCKEIQQRIDDIRHEAEQSTIFSLDLAKLEELESLKTALERKECKCLTSQ